jgi:sterol desaturase/sphingolipid hydroxylase (fatty acid hydroxylase superfamily)
MVHTNNVFVALVGFAVSIVIFSYVLNRACTDPKTEELRDPRNTWWLWFSFFILFLANDFFSAFWDILFHHVPK